MKKPSHTNQVRLSIQQLQQQVQDVLTWTSEAYANHQHETGLRYLHEVFGTDVPMIDHMPHHREYWNWWRIHYMRTDREFIETLPLLRTGEREEYYKLLHSMTGFGYTPQATLMEKIYMHMMHQLVKNQTQKL